MSKAKAKDNPFSFFAYEKKAEDLFDSDDDIFADTTIPSKHRGVKANSKQAKSSEAENPFSFFRGVGDNPPPPPNPVATKQNTKQPNKDSIFDSSEDDDWASPTKSNGVESPPLPDVFPHTTLSPR